MKTKAKKVPYVVPTSEALHFETSGSILTSSNEGYSISPFDPEFISSGALENDSFNF